MTRRRSSPAELSPRGRAAVHRLRLSRRELKKLGLGSLAKDLRLEDREKAVRERLDEAVRRQTGAPKVDPKKRDYIAVIRNDPRNVDPAVRDNAATGDPEANEAGPLTDGGNEKMTPGRTPRAALPPAKRHASKSETRPPTPSDGPPPGENAAIASLAAAPGAPDSPATRWARNTADYKAKAEASAAAGTRNVWRPPPKTGGHHPRNVSGMLASPRCGARTRAGTPCRSPAVAGKRRCRMHGGAAGSGAPKGNQNALKRGHFTAAAITRRRKIQESLREGRGYIEDPPHRRS